MTKWAYLGIAACIAGAAGTVGNANRAIVVACFAAAVVFGAALVAGTAFKSTAMTRGWGTAHDVLDRELERGRRYGRPFSLVRFELDTARSSDDVLGEVTAILRRIDGVTSEGRVVWIVLAEAGTATAEHVVKRLVAADRGSLIRRPSVVTYPDDGITSGGLLEAARRKAGSALPVRPTLVAVEPVTWRQNRRQ